MALFGLFVVDGVVKVSSVFTVFAAVESVSFVFSPTPRAKLQHRRLRQVALVAAGVIHHPVCTVVTRGRMPTPANSCVLLKLSCMGRQMPCDGRGFGELGVNVGRPDQPASLGAPMLIWWPQPDIRINDGWVPIRCKVKMLIISLVFYWPARDPFEPNNGLARSPNERRPR